MPPSISENNLFTVLTDQDLRIYSVGISTGGVAEERMAAGNPRRRIIATTIDPEGAEFAKKRLSDFSEQIAIKIENVAEPLPYDSHSFDFIYARLVLHYLNKAELKLALNELYRVLKKGGRLFAVVRSTECQEAQGSIYDPATGLSTYTSSSGTYQRYFHTDQSIREHLSSSRFSISYTKSYEELLFVDFQRTRPAYIDTLIEAVGYKQ